MTIKQRRYFEFEGIQLPCILRESRRAKNITLTFENDGILIVTLPYFRRNHDIESVLLKHKKWIIKKFNESKKKKRISPPFLLTDGAQLPVLDKSYTLSLLVSDKKRTQWSFRHKRLIISGPRLHQSLISKGIILWYREMAALYIEHRLPFWAAKMNVSPKQTRIKNQHTLWGSCSKKRSVNFNWRILLLSQEAADYLIIHELSHLKELNHSPNFWKIVGMYCPEYKTLKAELRNKNDWLKYPDLGLPKEEL